jgi:hypothetical protein
MKLLKYLTGCLLGASFFIACANHDSTADNEVEKQAATKEEWQPEMYAASELVALMRQIHSDQLVVRNEILQGKMPAEMPAKYAEMHTATSTNPSEINLTYHELADVWMADYKTMTEANQENVKEKYNNLVTSCVNCHRNYCQGPIPKIEKLYIK